MAFRLRLPIRSCALPLLLFAACDSERAEATDVLWSTPDLPGPLHLEVDGEGVDEVILEGFLLSEWGYWYSRNSDRLEGLGLDAAFREFLGADAERVEPLVGDVLLLREAERRYPDLDEHEVDAFLAAMRGRVGDVVDALEKRYGPEGLRDHARRQVRTRKLLAEIGAVVEEPTREEVVAEWQRMLGDLEFPEEVPEEEAAELLPSFQEMESRVYARMLQDRRDAAAWEWIAERRAGVEATFTCADGSTIVLPSP